MLQDIDAELDALPAKGAIAIAHLELLVTLGANTHVLATVHDTLGPLAANNAKVILGLHQGLQLVHFRLQRGNLGAQRGVLLLLLDQPGVGLQQLAIQGRNGAQVLPLQGHSREQGSRGGEEALSPGKQSQARVGETPNSGLALGQNRTIEERVVHQQIPRLGPEIPSLEDVGGLLSQLNGKPARDQGRATSRSSPGRGPKGAIEDRAQKIGGGLGSGAGEPGATKLARGSGSRMRRPPRVGEGVGLLGLGEEAELGLKRSGVVELGVGVGVGVGDGVGGRGNYDSSL